MGPKSQTSLEMKLDWTTDEQDKLHWLNIEGNILQEVEQAQFLEEVAEKLKSQDWPILCDLSHLKFINSSGISFFVKLLTKARIAGTEIYLFNLNEKIVQLFQITKMNEVFEIADNRETAIKLAKKA